MKNVRRKTTTSFISAPKTLLSASSLPISIRAATVSVDEEDPFEPTRFITAFST
ncbi:hypothetical protein HID58_053583 [Brassica napus]|uniref:Uncharacterized protein n=1 Tax=Brassica napus TaxID=3708 RepID=A0ABQ8AF43_BRANA|nr:hypothetical protein HID58_053583 [Brassica napus]